MIARIGYLFAAFFLLTGQSQTESWLAFEPEVVSLQGVLVIEKHFGPPNYGEGPHDREATVLVLRLAAPISVRGSPASDINRSDITGIWAVQLVADWGIKEFQEFANKSISVRGSLFSAHTAHHYFDILLQVDEVQLVDQEWRGVSNQFLEAVRAQDMAALLSIFKSPQYYQDDEEVMADLKDYFWEAEWFKKKFPDGKSIYEIAMSEDIVHFGTLQPDGTFIVVYIPKSQVSAMGSPGFLENQWMREYFACRFGQVEGVWKLVGTPCFYQAGGPYQEPYG